MYLWLIIATFIASIAAMNVSIRSDIKELYVEPQAQNVVTKLYVQHKAAMNHLSQRNRNSTSTGMSYRPGELTPLMLKADLPYGFNPNSGISQFKTWVYCLDKDNLESAGAAALPASCTGGAPVVPGEGESDKPDEGNGTNCCVGPSVVTYLVTYGCVPIKWRDIRSGKPDGLLLNAMRTVTGFTNGMGYAIDRTELSKIDENLEIIKTDMGVYGQGGEYYEPIPRYITSTSMGKSSFANMCGSSRNNNADFDPDAPESSESLYGSCDYCLVYMTPF